MEGKSRSELASLVSGANALNNNVLTGFEE
jgi:hypothetical protein